MNQSTTPTRLLNERDAARYLGISPATLRKHRSMGTIPGKVEGPPWIKAGPRAIRYAIEDLDAWIDSRRTSR
jgi:predicted DNA-binding transcriptional regulator AlpA